MKIIAVLNQKGGVGKTTLATNIAAKLNETHKVLLVDSDCQGSARDWHALRESYGRTDLTLVALDRPNLMRDIAKIGAGFDYAVIDGAPRLEEMAAATIKCADLVIIPVQPSEYDVWATDELIKFIKCRQEIANGQPKSYFFISRKIPNTRVGKRVYQKIEQYEMPVMAAFTSQRVAYIDSVKWGQSVTEYLPINQDALREITTITDEIRGILDK